MGSISIKAITMTTAIIIRTMATARTPPDFAGGFVNAGWSCWALGAGGGWMTGANEAPQFGQKETPS